MTTAPLTSAPAVVAGDDGTARRWLAEHGLPTRRDEVFRYAPLAALTAAADDPGGRRSPGATEVAAALGDLPDGWRVVLVDGEYAPELSRLGPGGPTVEPDAATSRAVPVPRDGFEALNRLWSPRPVVIRAGRDDGQTVVHVLHLLTGAASHPRVEVEVGAGHRASVVETVRSLTPGGFTTAATTIDAGPDSRVEHLLVLPPGVGPAHVLRTDVVAHERAEVALGAVALGGGPGHHHLAVTLDGPGARATLTGLAVPGPGGHHDTVATVRHRASHGTSRQQFAAIVPDRGRSSFTGHVVVAAGTVGTDADQQDRNLLLGPTARADTRPWLEIHSDEVACTHGATVGRLDEDGLFYLRSRGFTAAAARALLVRAFATTLVEQMTSAPALRAWVADAVTEAITAALADGPTDDPADGLGPSGVAGRAS